MKAQEKSAFRSSGLVVAENGKVKRERTRRATQNHGSTLGCGCCTRIYGPPPLVVPRRCNAIARTQAKKRLEFTGFVPAVIESLCGATFGVAEAPRLSLSGIRLSTGETGKQKPLLYFDENIPASIIDNFRKRSWWKKKVKVLSAVELGNQGRSDDFHSSTARGSDTRSSLLIPTSMMMQPTRFQTEECTG
ncbi:hypothetical protein [Bradyrhizobium sp. SZCCHNRI2013]|uniref:hypothetical protein n=1 Tax=Bradyrhizobium sp. SZCCHNRI2013 TaxID=3057284 RepID=UPI0029166347|nr:hypothetical protein [Bradyrhizobium sp. SZCCHNRI2013]